MREIEQGVGDTGIRCGVIKIATGDGEVSDYERKVLTAASRAAKITSVPLISHTEGAVPAGMSRSTSPPASACAPPA